MSPELEQSFEEIITTAIEAAEEVPCEIHEFVEGLKLMRDELNDRIAAEG